MDRMAMFPLGTVLLPGMLLPLRVFEPRYQLMLADVLASDECFGVVLIERGPEVGGGDVRSSVGTVAHIEAHEDMGRGRHSLIVLGVERLKVTRWLPDDPYPQAEISRWPDVAVDTPSSASDSSAAHSDPSRPTPWSESQEPPSTLEAQLDELYMGCIVSLRKLLASAGKRGHNVVPATFRVPDDPVPGSYLLGGFAPLGAFDRQRLLEASDAYSRLVMLDSMIAEQRMLLSL